MSLYVLASGTLVADPQPRTSAAGKQYITASMRVPIDGEDSVLASLIAFESDAIKALAQLHKGDPVSVAGQGKLTTWTGRDGTEKRGLGVTVQAVLSVYQARKRMREAQQLEDPRPYSSDEPSPEVHGSEEAEA
jgi:single-stranded DNA-binding protein